MAWSRVESLFNSQEQRGRDGKEGTYSVTSAQGRTKKWISPLWFRYQSWSTLPSRRRWTTGSAHSMSCSVLKILCFSIRFKVELPRADLVVHILLKCCMAGTSEKALLCFPLTKFRSCSVQWHDSSGAIGREVVCVETHGSSFDLFFNPECYHLFIS